MGRTRQLAVLLVLGILAAAMVVGVSPAGAADVTVNATDTLRFDPTSVTIRAGDTVTWRNPGTVAHTVTSDGDGGARIDDELPAGGVVTMTFTTAGTFEYFCRFHASEGSRSGMVGTVVVQPAPSARTTDRLSGAGRIQTAIAISKEAFPNGASTVYLSSQDVNPDALVGGALTAGPILLVPSCGTLPAEVAAEIRRLGADRVVALGGARTVCDDMLRQAGNA